MMSDFTSLFEEGNKNLVDTDLHNIPDQITTKITIVERLLNRDKILINPAYEKIIQVGRHSSYFEALKRFIETHGQRYPIVINQYGIILDGHKIFRALKELGFSPIRCEVKTYEDEFDEQVFIINSNLNPALPEYQLCMLLVELQKVLQSKVLRRQDLRYMTHGTWMGSYLTSLEFRCGILDWILCCFCVLDGKEDPFVDLCESLERKDKRGHIRAKHVLSHLHNKSGFGGRLSVLNLSRIRT